MSIGRLYFAAVGDDEIFDEDVHLVEDLEVYNVRISHSEAEFARAELQVTNPREGLLLDSRRQRLFISCEETPGGPIVLLFSGRITGFPLDLDAEIVVLEYLAQPEDWQETQSTFLDTLKVQPYYNELFIPVEDRDEAEEVLAARSALLHWNRSTGAVTLSDILQGSTTIDVGEAFFFDSLSTTIGDPPLKTVNLDIEVQWEQFGVGEVDVGEAVRQLFVNTTGPTPQFNSLTPESFQQGWESVAIPKGYEVLEKVVTPVANSFGLSNAVLQSAAASVDGTTYRTATGLDTGGNRLCKIPRVWFRARLRLLALYRQKRTERFSVVVASQSQDYALAGETSESIFLRLEDPVSEVNGAILDPSLPSFFTNVDTEEFTSYGEDVVQHGLLRARARLAKAMRAVETSLELPLEAGVLGISCDHSLRISDDRLPGTDVLGKVLGYSMEIDGDTGKQVLKVTIGSAVGLGFDSVGPPGSVVLEDIEYDTLNDDGVMESAIYYSDPDADVLVPVDVAQMESDNTYLIDNIVVDNPGQSQNNGFAASSTPDVYVETHKTKITVDMKTMNPEPVLEVVVGSVLQNITWPKQIDLGTTSYTLVTEDGDIITTEDGDPIVI